MKSSKLSPIVRLSELHNSVGDLIRQYLESLTRPHPDLGREGPVCPFTKSSLDSDHAFVREFLGQASFLDVKGTMARSLKDFLALEGSETSKILITAFPPNDVAGSEMLKQAHSELKIHFVKRGLMIGVFHPDETTGGLHSDKFQPFRSPLPMMVVRYMVAGDRPFFDKSLAAANAAYESCLEMSRIHRGSFPFAYSDSK